MSTVIPDRSAEAAAAEEELAAEKMEGVTSDQVMHAQDESRAEGEPYGDEE